MSDERSPAGVESKLQSPDIVITRVFEAPLESVWRAWTEPEQMKKWWGPRGFTAPVMKNDFRVGGQYLFDMRGPDGKDYWNTGKYLEIIPFKEIVATDSFADEQGHPVPPAYYGFDSTVPWELRARFEGYGDKTGVTLRHTGFPPGEQRDNAISGWNETLDKLAQVLAHNEIVLAKKTVFTASPGRQEITLTRIFDAPRDTVYRMYTDPKIIPQFWGPADLKTTVDKLDLRPGGMWRYVQRDSQGHEYAFHGFFHLVSPERLIYTFEFEGAPGDIMLEIADFIAEDGTTRVVSKDIFTSLEARDAAVKSGMEAGAVESMERFAEVLSKQLKR
jgi:uncharacterized protein YndB with AHSA1/START domain